MSAGTTLDDVVRAVRRHPGLLGKDSIGLVTDVLGPTDWVSGPGDDAAAVDVGTGRVVVGGEALWPPFVDADPRAAGIAAIVANVNDLAAMGARPLGIVDTIVAPEATARLALEGMAQAAAIYRVPIVGGHLTIRDGPASLSAFGIGEANRLLSSARVAPGLVLLVVTCLDGSMRDDFAFFSSIRQRSDRLGDDVRALAEVAEAGLCVAAKDVSMAGVLGSLAMLLECAGAGAAIDLEALPRPGGVALAQWATAFPTFSFLLCAPPDLAEACRDVFRRRGLDCERVGLLDGSGVIRLRLGGQERQLLDLRTEPVTGLDRANRSM
ncbi:MAG: AIR synthase related protein [Candidatus Dormibacteria bacterium]